LLPLPQLGKRLTAVVHGIKPADSSRIRSQHAVTGIPLTMSSSTVQQQQKWFPGETRQHIGHLQFRIKGVN
jgi:hypothetical protein